MFDSVALLPSVWLTAVLLLARSIAERHQLPCPTAAAILAATGASKSRANEIVAKLVAVLPTLVRAPGRPGQPSSPSTAASDHAELTRAALAYVMAHPGCVDRGVERNRYSDGFRRFVLDLHEQHPSVALDALAGAVAVPLGTLKDWLRHPPGAADEQPQEATAPAPRDMRGTHIQIVLDAWSRWSGSFLDFCEHVRRDLHVPFGRDLVRRILEVERRRKPARRAGRQSQDEAALRGSFRTFFPGAQWIGDGMQVPVVVDGQRFVFNVELDVDAYAGAFVGATVSDTEDSGAVIDTFKSGVTTTGAPPLALLLDNKPSNHTPDIDAALGETTRIRATVNRPQNKAHVEGAFGLFSQVLPPLVLDSRGAGAHELGRSLLDIVVGTWAHTTNHRPRKDRDGRSRVELYADAPTDEQIEQARRELRELADRQQRARQTLQARRRPEVLALLDEHFERLGLLDPEHHFRIVIAGYPKSAIVDGVAIFEAKRDANTLPDGADARYLLGIVKNVAAKTEGEYLAEYLYKYRMEAQQRFLAPLREEREALRDEPDVARVLSICVDNALETPSNLERSFWLDAIVETLRELPDDDERDRRFRHAARLIEATFAVSPRERHDAVRYVADRLVPVT